MTPHRAVYHSPSPKHLPLILAAAVGAFGVLWLLAVVASVMLGRLV